MSVSVGRSVSREDLTRFLQALVRAPSVNPPGNEAVVAPLVVGKLREMGFEVSVVEAEAGRPNVIGRLHGSGRGPTLLLNGHMDVQPPGGGWTHDPFGAEVHDGRLFGRGAVDMKAGLAAVLFAVQAVQRAGCALAGDLVITVVADEVEGGYKGTGHLTRAGLLRADMAVVCEPTGDKVNVAHRGALWAEIEVQGRSAHGGRPWLGVNAIGKAARIIRALEEDLLPRLQTRTHHLLPPPTINLGTIHGGTKFNLVADRCVLRLDRRLLTGESVASALGEIEEVCARVRAGDPETFSYVVREVAHVDPMEINEDAPVVRECQWAYHAVTGRHAGIGCTAGFEDAHFLMDAGIPTAMFGPYRRDEAGRPPFFTTSGMPDEYVDLADVVRAAHIYAELITHVLG